MALIAYDGFDHYNAIADIEQRLGALQWFNAGGSLINPGRAGYGKYFSSSTIKGGLAEPVAKLTVGMGLLVSSGVTNIEFVDQLTGATQCYFVVNAGNGTVSAHDASGTVVQTGLNKVANSGWFFMEFQALIGSGTSGAMACQINAEPALSVTGINTQASANASVSGVSIVSVSGIYGIDDAYFADGTTGPGAYPCNSFLGDVRCATLFAISDSSVSWTPLTGDNWQEISETAMDSDTSYNRSDTTGATDLFNMGSLEATINQVIGVQVTGAYRKEDAGSRTLTNVLQSGTILATGVARSPDVSYLYYTDLWATDPNTSASWTVDAVNALLAGYKIVT